MPTEYLEKRNTCSDTTGQNGILGIQACRFSPHQQKADDSILIPRDTTSFCLHMIFCCQGILTLERTNQKQTKVQAHEILLFSATDMLSSVHLVQPMEGVMVSIDVVQLSQSLQSLYTQLGTQKFNIRQIQECLQQHNSCLMVKRTPWSNAVFSTLAELPKTEWEYYGIWKAIELLYLLCTHNHLPIQSPSQTTISSRLAPTISAIHAYMQQHLDEKLTIASLSHLFCISPTTLKQGFRNLYGESVHTVLQHMRITRAAKLLASSTMTVLQIAQLVGYDGVSQFNMVFKKTYGVTPTQYRKMSISVEGCPIPQDR